MILSGLSHQKLELISEMQMIFRASAGSGVTNLYELWMSSMAMNENNPRLLTKDTHVKGVYKSPLVEQWNAIELASVF